MKSLTKSLGALALFTAVTVHAQPNAAPAGPAPAGATPPAVSPAPAQLSIPEMKDRFAAVDAQVAEDARYMRHLQDVARKEKDVVKLTCVNDKLVELKAQQNIYDETKLRFEASLSTDSRDGAQSAFDGLVMTSSDVKLLRGEAEACVGVPDLYKQESDVNVTHPDFPDDPTTTDPFLPEMEPVEPPAFASPFY